MLVLCTVFLSIVVFEFSTIHEQPFGLLLSLGWRNFSWNSHQNISKFFCCKNFPNFVPLSSRDHTKLWYGRLCMEVFLKKSYGGVFFNFFMEVLSDFFYWNLIKAGEPAVPHNWSGKAKPLSNTFLFIHIYVLLFIIDLER